MLLPTNRLVSSIFLPLYEDAPNNKTDIIVNVKTNENRLKQTKVIIDLPCGDCYSVYGKSLADSAVKGHLYE